MWDIFRLTTGTARNRQYTLLSVNIMISVYKFITLLHNALKFLVKV